MNLSTVSGGLLQCHPCQVSRGVSSPWPFEPHLLRTRIFRRTWWPPKIRTWHNSPFKYFDMCCWLFVCLLSRKRTYRTRPVPHLHPRRTCSRHHDQDRDPRLKVRELRGLWGVKGPTMGFLRSTGVTGSTVLGQGNLKEGPCVCPGSRTKLRIYRGPWMFSPSKWKWLLISFLKLLFQFLLRRVFTTPTEVRLSGVDGWWGDVCV